MKKFNLMNSKGISVIFLLIAMLLMVTIGYVFSYLIPTKQKSVRFQIYSPQAFFIAQSGVEFAIRYASDQGWRGATDNGVFDLNRLNGISRPLGNGSFTINYNNATGDILTSTGQITGSTENRVVRVSSFSDFLRLVFTTPAPAWTTGTRQARFYIINVRVPNVTLLSFSASWTAQNNRTISAIYFNGTAAANQRFAGPPNYVNSSTAVNFNRNGNSYTISPTPPSASTSVYIYWNNNLGTNSNITITFYTGTLGTGDAYTFDLDSAGNGL